jgi:NAD(P)-dependent dehydrogenase (short-subunit alcohol dehydrogenase family)
MDLDLAGRSAVVTGGSKGIGLAIVRGLAAAGARVIVGARTSSAELDELARTGQVRVVLADLADPAGPASLIGQAGDRIDVLVKTSAAPRPGPGGSCPSPMRTGAPRSNWT